MASQCLPGRVLLTVGCDRGLARRPLRLLTDARSQTSACTRTRPSGSIHGHFLGSCKAVTPFTNASSQKNRHQHRIATQAYNQQPDIADRVVASVPYLIPLCDGLRYGECNCMLKRICSSSVRAEPFHHGCQYPGCNCAGKFFFAQFPAFARILAPLNPLVSLYFGVPFAR